MKKSSRKCADPPTDRPPLGQHGSATGAANLAEIRAAIDRIDGEIVRLLAERLVWTRDAARFKANEGEVAAPARAAAVVARAVALGAERGVPAEIVEPVYRAMIAASIEDQRRIFRQIAR
ncbi:MAG TPA: chorismate mutase [Alphaproteobacteria bacterium]